MTRQIVFIVNMNGVYRSKSKTSNLNLEKQKNNNQELKTENTTQNNNLALTSLESISCFLISFSYSCFGFSDVRQLFTETLVDTQAMQQCRTWMKMITNPKPIAICWIGILSSSDGQYITYARSHTFLHTSHHITWHKAATFPAFVLFSYLTVAFGQICEKVSCEIW